MLIDSGFSYFWSIVWTYLIAWLLSILLAIVNGAFREKCYKPLVGNLFAHWISTALILVLLAFYLWLVGKWWRRDSAMQGWLIGGIWRGLTILLEFGLGYYVMGHPWTKLLHNNNIFQGRVWVLVLVALLVGPRISYSYFQQCIAQ